jgi:uncharacterized membrane protein
VRDSEDAGVGARGRLPVWSPQRASGRIFYSALGGVLVTWLVPSAAEVRIRAVLGWDVAALIFLGMAANLLVRSCPVETKRRASAEDPGRNTLWAVVTAACLFSLFAAMFVLRSLKNMPGLAGRMWSILALLAVLLSWLVTHTLYTFRYAHLYYRGTHEGGMVFPGTRPPADIDFAYFAFTIGMCFQVSDVTIESSRIRRAALGHALLSFVYNTTILALALNTGFALLG